MQIITHDKIAVRVSGENIQDTGQKRFLFIEVATNQIKRTKMSLLEETESHAHP